VTVRRAVTDLSTLDLVGRDAVLFTGPDGAGWARAAAAAGERLDLSVDVCRVGEGGDVDDPRGEFAKAYGLGPGGATLVRPDGVIAWRARDAVDDPGDALGAALAHTFCRSR
jgi:hypothetical protein